MKKRPHDSHEKNLFSQNLANSLEQSLSHLDPEVNEQLDNARIQAQETVKKPWRGVAAAAVLALLILPLWHLSYDNTESSTVAENSEASDDMNPGWYLSMEPDLLADWEMLEAIGEIPDA